LIQSDLKGINSSLPKPFNKENSATKLVTIKYNENNKYTSLQLKYADILNFCNQTKLKDLSQIKAHINFYNNNCSLPAYNVTSITGKLNLSNYSQWQIIHEKENESNGSISNKPKIEFDLHVD